MSKKYRLNNCCLCIPLRIGSIIAIAWMIIWYLYVGILALVNRTHIFIYKESFGLFLGVFYIGIALFMFNGLYGIFYEIQCKVKWLATILFPFSLILYMTFSFIEMILLAVSYSYIKKDCESVKPVHDGFCSYSFVRWGATLATGVVTNLYSYIVVKSYSRKLEEISTDTPSSDDSII